MAPTALQSSLSSDPTPSDGDARGCPALSGVTIVLCNSCRLPANPHLDPRPGSLLTQATEDAAKEAGIATKRVGCLGNCRRGLSAAILRAGSWSYVFGELTQDSAPDLIAGAKLFAGSTDGFMPYGDRPDSLKRGLIARIPTLENLKDLP